MTIAKDGQEAFELVKQSMTDRNLFNLIFMDVQVRAFHSPDYIIADETETPSSLDACT